MNPLRVELYAERYQHQLDSLDTDLCNKLLKNLKQLADAVK